MDYDVLRSTAIFALIAWNLKETVAIGKRVVRLETKVDNGLAADVRALTDLKGKIERHMEGEEERIIASSQKKRRYRRR